MTPTPLFSTSSFAHTYTELALAGVLSLPLHPGPSDDDVARAIREITVWAG